MQAIKPLAVAFSLLAFASVSAFAEEAKKNQAGSSAKASMSQSTSKSAGATRLDFDKADKNKDGQLSRAEFDAMLKGDAGASAGGSASAKPDRPKSSSTTK